MIKFYLITGFLGAGKTTFLKNFLNVITNLNLNEFAPENKGDNFAKDEQSNEKKLDCKNNFNALKTAEESDACAVSNRIHLIINEFGKQGVDGTLLKEIGAVLDEINNGSIFCACRLDKFETVLKNAIQTAPDIIIAEASGLADPTNVRAVLRQFSEIEYMGSICLADAVRLNKVYDTAQVCKRQIAVSSLVLLNKIDAASPEQCNNCEELIKNANPAADIERVSFGEMKKEFLHKLKPNPDIESAAISRDITLQKHTLKISENTDITALKGILTIIADSTYRMKGFVKIKEGTFHVDCTGPDIQIKPYSDSADNNIVLLAGKGMPLRKAVKQASEWYKSNIIEG